MIKLYKSVKKLYTQPKRTKGTNDYKTISYIVWHNTNILPYILYRILTIK